MHKVLDRFIYYLDAYVVCFSAARDLLSQWRAYGQQGGYAIGFSGGALQSVAAAPRTRISLVPVVYDPEVQQEQISESAPGGTQP